VLKANSKKVIKLTSAEEIYDEGVLLMYRGDIEGAIAKYRIAASIKPKLWQAWLNL